MDKPESSRQQRGDIESRARQLALDHCERKFSESDAWYIELVKHLALINSAGLAGVCAIYATDSTSTRVSAGYPSALYFVAGLICAVLVMSITSASMQRRATAMLERVQQLDRGEIAAHEVLGRLETGLSELRVTRWLGIGALAAFALGAWPFLRVAIE